MATVGLTGAWNVFSFFAYYALCGVLCVTSSLSVSLHLGHERIGAFCEKSICRRWDLFLTVAWGIYLFSRLVRMSFPCMVSIRMLNAFVGGSLNGSKSYAVFPSPPCDKLTEGIGTIHEVVQLR